jgi:hypothetical protein
VIILENVRSSKDEVYPIGEQWIESIQSQYVPIHGGADLVLGCMSYGSDAWAKWVLNEDKSLPLLKAAWDAGIQTWDTADIYSNVLVPLSHVDD